jgi:hypothetical protein
VVHPLESAEAPVEEALHLLPHIALGIGEDNLFKVVFDLEEEALQGIVR